LAELAARGRAVRRPRHVFCVVDHIVDTRPGRGDATLVPGGEEFIVGLRRGAARCGLRLFDVDDADQGIGHLVSAEQRIAQAYLNGLGLGSAPKGSNAASRPTAAKGSSFGAETVYRRCEARPSHEQLAA